MKRILLATAAVVAMSGSAMAAGTIDLTGTVASACTITAGPAAFPLNMSVLTAQTGTTLSVTCNSFTGYKLTASSLNLGTLIHSGGAPAVPYQVTFDGQAALASLAAPVIGAAHNPGAITTAEDISFAVTLGSAGPFAGTYSDTVTVEVAPA
jgi:hypothetical protein